MTDTTVLVPVVAEHIAAVNAFDQAAIVATFADDALVNDAHREFWGHEAIARWVAKEMVGDRVSIEVTEVIDHHGQTIVRGRYDGDFEDLAKVIRGEKALAFTPAHDLAVHETILRASGLPVD